MSKQLDRFVLCAVRPFYRVWFILTFAISWHLSLIQEKVTHTHTHTGTNQHACGRQHDISCLLSQQRHTVHQRNHFARSAESWLMVAAAHKETLRLTRFSIRWPLPLCTCYANCYMTGSRINLARTLGCKNAPSWTQSEDEHNDGSRGSNSRKRKKFFPLNHQLTAYCVVRISDVTSDSLSYSL